MPRKQSRSADRLPNNFPFRDIIQQFITEYSTCPTYWYVPKARVLSEENIQFIKKVLEVIFEYFLGRKWNQDLQSELYEKLTTDEALQSYKTADEQTIPDRNALIRIVKKLIAFLGLLWVDKDAEIVITDAGLDLLGAADPQAVIEKQIAKYQYPNPAEVTSYASQFAGLLTHIFVLEVPVEVDLVISRDEFELFVNLAQSHADLPRIVRYIKTWRDLSEEEQETVANLVKGIPVAKPYAGPGKSVATGTRTRFSRISKDASYQIRFHTYPRYLQYEDDAICSQAPRQVDIAVREWKKQLKVARFRNPKDWYAYYGDPEQQPSWAIFLAYEIEASKTHEAAEAVTAEYKDQIGGLSDTERQALARQRAEKWIEECYLRALDRIEEGLELYEDAEQDGQQFSTAIGRLDLLCVNKSTDEYVVIEIKANEANDATFGQILRYIGWVHRNLPGG